LWQIKSWLSNSGIIHCFSLSGDKYFNVRFARMLCDLPMNFSLHNFRQAKSAVVSNNNNTTTNVKIEQEDDDE